MVKQIRKPYKRFRYWRDIESAVREAKKTEKIRLVGAEECIELKDLDK